jgi:hypothetical protein
MHRQNTKVISVCYVSAYGTVTKTQGASSVQGSTIPKSAGSRKKHNRNVYAAEKRIPLTIEVVV